jgi:hypothetical protein
VDRKLGRMIQARPTSRLREHTPAIIELRWQHRPDSQGKTGGRNIDRDMWMACVDRGKGHFSTNA